MSLPQMPNLNLQDIERMQKVMESLEKLAPFIELLTSYLPPIEIKALKIKDPDDPAKSKEYLAILLPPAKKQEPSKEEKP